MGSHLNPRQASAGTFTTIFLSYPGIPLTKADWETRAGHPPFPHREKHPFRSPEPPGVQPRPLCAQCSFL